MESLPPLDQCPTLPAWSPEPNLVFHSRTLPFNGSVETFVKMWGSQWSRKLGWCFTAIEPFGIVSYQIISPELQLSNFILGWNWTFPKSQYVFSGSVDLELQLCSHPAHPTAIYGWGIQPWCVGGADLEGWSIWMSIASRQQWIIRLMVGSWFITPIFGCTQQFQDWKKITPYKATYSGWGTSCISYNVGIGPCPKFVGKKITLILCPKHLS